jgi:hypothetical protein
MVDEELLLLLQLMTVVVLNERSQRSVDIQMCFLLT